MPRYCLPLFMIALSSVSAEARNNVGVDFTISVAPPPPPAHVVITAPRGYTRCYVTRSMWLDGVWVPAHKECVYEQSGRESIWVSGYWGCMAASPNGHCARWTWNANGWSNRSAVRAVHGHQHNPGYGYTQRVHQHRIEHSHESIRRNGPREITVHGHESNHQHDNQSLHHHP